GGGFAWAENSYFFRLTPWYNDPVSDPMGEVLYLSDEAAGSAAEPWTPTPGPAPARDAPTGRAEPPGYTVSHEPGRTTFLHTRDGIATEMTVGVPVSDAVKVTRLRITNRGARPRQLRLTSFVEWSLGAIREHTRHQIHTWRDADTGALFAENFFASDFTSRVAFSWVSEATADHTASFTANREEFIGRNGDLVAPAGLSRATLSGTTGAGYDPCAAFRASLVLAPGESRDVVVLLGAAESQDAAREIIARLRDAPMARDAVDAAVQAWTERLSTISVRTPSPTFDAMLNRWSLYQALSCRMWARSALYQSSGAYGFRDQLQDCMAFLYAEADIARAHILRSAAHQFAEGDVQHWWHEPSGRGVRTRFSDDLAWLPFVADRYVTVTGDDGIWEERVHFIAQAPLAPGEQEAYEQPTTSDESGTLYEHCVRALDRACTTGVHGLPLIGSGDWNDGMNRVGIEGKGESVWLAWFLIATLRQFATRADARGDATAATRFRAHAAAYADAAEREAWDGEWYRRAYFDDGTPLGSAGSDECKIDAIAQSWSVISGAADPERARRAMRSVDTHLVREDARLIMLLTPPFDRSSHDPGYIKGYVPGVRENGAQYTHAALWTALAAARLGDGDHAFHLLDLLNPLTHAETPAGASTYKVEPYVVCADVYTAVGHVGRGGWTWYTGSASWMYRVALEAILGFTKQGDRLTIDPCVPAGWRDFTIAYRHRSSSYNIAVENPSGVSRGVLRVTIDGREAPDRAIALADDGLTHAVAVTMGRDVASAGGGEATTQVQRA
ncbi:MAG: glycosyl transferase family 36, partial [Gemmatimonadota bacterium]|nr:glycosyl transferase family 36 [Gemmatimonadota bacterium]